MRNNACLNRCWIDNLLLTRSWNDVGILATNVCDKLSLVISSWQPNNPMITSFGSSSSNAFLRILYSG